MIPDVLEMTDQGRNGHEERNHDADTQAHMIGQGKTFGSYQDVGRADTGHERSRQEGDNPGLLLTQKKYRNGP